MAEFKIFDAGIACVTRDTADLFQGLEVAEAKTLSAADISTFMAMGQTYLRLDDPAKPFLPNPIDEPNTGMFLYIHPDAYDAATGRITDPTQMIGLYYDVERDTANGMISITPRKWLLGPRATAVIPYQWTCCGGWSAILVGGDNNFQPGQDLHATATIIDPPTVQPHHEQFFYRPDGGQIAFDTTGELRHAFLHLAEQEDPSMSHNCANHGALDSGHRPAQLALKKG